MLTGYQFTSFYIKRYFHSQWETFLPILARNGCYHMISGDKTGYRLLGLEVVEKEPLGRITVLVMALVSIRNKLIKAINF